MRNFGSPKAALHDFFGRTFVTSHKDSNTPTPVIGARINIDRLGDGRTGNSIAFSAQWALSNERFYRDHKMDAPS
jgi:hypothetical protein